MAKALSLLALALPLLAGAAPAPSAPRVMICNTQNELVRAAHASGASRTYWAQGKDQSSSAGEAIPLLRTMLESLALASSTGIFTERLEPVSARELLFEFDRGVAFRAGAEGCLEVLTGPAAREQLSKSAPEPEAR